MSDLRELYQETILDHYKQPRNFSDMPDYDRISLGHNPLCGDKLTLFVKLNGDRIEKVTFQGSGCAISTASASMMTEHIVGKTLKEAQNLFGQFHEMVTEHEDKDNETTFIEAEETMGKLAVFAGVAEYPARVKCATLSWQTLKAALENKEEVST